MPESGIINNTESYPEITAGRPRRGEREGRRDEHLDRLARDRVPALGPGHHGRSARGNRPVTDYTTAANADRRAAYLTAATRSARSTTSRRCATSGTPTRSTASSSAEEPTDGRSPTSCAASARSAPVSWPVSAWRWRTRPRTRKTSTPASATTPTPTSWATSSASGRCTSPTARRHERRHQHQRPRREGRPRARREAHRADRHRGRGHRGAPGAVRGADRGRRRRAGPGRAARRAHVDRGPGRLIAKVANKLGVEDHARGMTIGRRRARAGRWGLVLAAAAHRWRPHARAGAPIPIRRSAPPAPVGRPPSSTTRPNAFATAIPSLTTEERRALRRRQQLLQRQLGHRARVDRGRDGLGPLFNAQSCSTCHFRDGRAAAARGRRRPRARAAVPAERPGRGRRTGPSPRAVVRRAAAGPIDPGRAGRG